MANKLVQLVLRAKNAISPSASAAAEDLRKVRNQARGLELELNKFKSAQNAVKELDTVRKAATEADQSFDQARREVERLKQELKANKTPELSLALEKAKIAAADAKKEMKLAGQAVQTLERRITSAGGDLDDLTGSQQRFAQAISESEKKVNRQAGVLAKAERKYNRVTEATNRSATSVKGWVAALAGTVASLAIVDRIKDGMLSLAQAVFRTGDEFELLSKRLNPEELAFIEQFARDTPLQLQGVADAFAQLRNYGLDPTNGSLQAMVDTNAALGGSQEKLEGIITAIGQAWSKQKLQAEELNQLIERGVPVWDLLAEATGRSVVELRSLSEAGRLGQREIKLLLAEMAKANGGAAEQAMDTLSGRVSNLQDSFTQFYRKIAESGALDSLKRALADVQAEITAMANDGRLARYAQQVSDFFTGMIKWSREAAKALNDNFGTIVATASTISNSIGLIFDGLVAGVTGATAVVARSIEKLSNVFGGGEVSRFAGSMADGFESAFNRAAASARENGQQIISSLNLVGKNMDEVSKQADTSANSVSDSSKQMADGVKNVSDNAEVAGKNVQTIGDGAEESSDKLSEGTQRMGESLQQVADDSKDSADQVNENMGEVGDGLEQVGDQAESASRDVKAVAASLAAWFIGVRNELKALSAEAENTFLNKLGIDAQPALDEIGLLEQGIEQARQVLGDIQKDNLSIFDATGVNKWKNSVLQAKNETIIAYNEQKLKFLEYMEALESGEGVNQSFINSAQNSVQWMELLGNEDLSTLRGALDSARQKLEAMNEQAKSTLGSLQDELDRLDGNQAAIEERDYQRKRDELNEKLEEAQRWGNQQAIKQYQEALRVLEEIRKEKKQTLQSGGRAAPSNAASSRSRSAASESRRRTTIELKGPSGTREIQTDDKGAENLLGALQEWGVRTE